jgi:subtilisin family serine protease
VRFHLFSKLPLSLAVTAVLAAGCLTGEEDFSEAVDTTMAPLLGDATDAIPDEYIVVFRDDIGAGGMDPAMNRIALRDAHSRIMRQYDIVPGFAARLSARDLAAIRSNPDVKYVERNGLVRAAKVETVQAQGIDRIDQRDLPRDGLYDDRNFDGTGVRVYIIDTGIRPTHTEFAGRVDGLHDVTGGNGIDCNGHGTHVASTVAGAQLGVVDHARIHSVRVLNCQGAGSFAGVIAGINLVAQQCAAGTPCAANMGLEGGFSQAVNDATTNAINAGTPFAVSAGNSGTNACSGSPASVPAAMTTAAVDGNDNFASFSNGGACVDILAPGVNILGATISSDTATVVFSGTSHASPHVCGVMAQFLQANPNATPAQVEAALEGNATPNTITNVPPGTPNLMLFNGVNVPPADTCRARCGNFDPTKPCQCDDVCVTFGDCCPDFQQFCGIDPNSCLDNNTCGGQAPGGCFCDSQCVTFGDCCPDGPC